MQGLTRDQASRGLSAGWRKDTLLYLDEVLRCGETGGDFVADWAFATNPDPSCGLVSRHLIYSSFTPQDIDLAFGPARDEVVAFCDGSGNKNDGPAGIGVVVYRPWTRAELIAENIGLGTNNRAELCAVWRALRAVPNTSQKLLIRTDSEYSIGSLTKEWARNFNASLIENIRIDLAQRPNVRFLHVDGHSGIEGNETADRLAGMGRKIVTLVTPYEG